MKYYDIEQNSDEWFALRLGKFTASTFKNLFAKETTDAYQKEINTVVFETLAGKSPESFSNNYMERGRELEPLAREVYETEHFSAVKNGGFWEYNEWVGCSPDGLVNDDGLLEIKCPTFNTQIDYLLKQKLPSEYFYQVHGQMLVTGRKWCDFFSFHPELPAFETRVEYSKEVNEKIEKAVKAAIEVAQKRINSIKKL